jgi:hypothetical protein
MLEEAGNGFVFLFNFNIRKVVYLDMISKLVNIMKRH